MIRAVLFDVGGTLFEDRDDASDAVRLARLQTILPCGDSWHAQLLAPRLEPLVYHEPTHTQDTRGAIRHVLERNGTTADDALVERIRAACCVPLSAAGAAPRIGALDALRHAKRRGLTVALVTNVLWRTQADVLADWATFGFAEVDSAVTSLDVGRYKPHPAMFERALTDLHIAGPDAVMVGNSREADIAPAKRLGMRAVLVRSREASWSEVLPDAEVAEMIDLPAVLDRWV